MSTDVINECISWLIKVTDKNDAWWKPEIQQLNFLLYITRMATTPFVRVMMVYYILQAYFASELC